MTRDTEGNNEFVYVSYFGFPEEQSLGQRFGDRKFTWVVIPRALSREMGNCGTKEGKLRKGFNALVSSVAGLISFNVLGTLQETMHLRRILSTDEKWGIYVGHLPLTGVNPPTLPGHLTAGWVVLWGFGESPESKHPEAHAWRVTLAECMELSTSAALKSKGWGEEARGKRTC